jgi:hypothetical protein
VNKPELSRHELEVAQRMAAVKTKKIIQPSIAEGTAQTGAKAVAGKKFGEPRSFPAH